MNMVSTNIGEVFKVANNKELTETGGGHNQKGVDFQRAWALARMFELEKSGAQDFLFLFEAIQDIVELDSSDSPSSIRIYQVKKKDRGEWKWNELTNLLEPDKKKAEKQPPSDIKSSPIGKLYSSVLAFKQLKSSGRFVSNSGCNLPLAGGANAATSLPCDLSQLETKHLDLLSKGLETLHETGTLSAKPSLIQVEKVPLPPDAPATYLRGLVLAFLQDRSPKHSGQATSLVDALLAKISPLGAKTNTCSNFDDLRNERGYSREEFIAAIGTLEEVPDQEAILNLWLNQLVSEGGSDFIEVASIRVAAARIFKQKVLGGEDPLADALVADCDKWLEDNTPGATIKDFIAKARSDLAGQHAQFRSAEFTAHFLLRAAHICVDQI